METANSQVQGMKMFLTENAEKDLKTTASWTKFYAILYFIGAGAMVLCGLMLLLLGKMPIFDSMSGMNQAMPMHGMNFGLIGIVYMILGIIMILPGVFLCQFAKSIKSALWNNNVATFELAVAKMKSYWMFMGILAIAMIVVAVIITPIIAILSVGCMV